MAQAAEYAAHEIERRDKAISTGKRYQPLRQPVLSKANLAVARAGTGPRGELSGMDVLPYCDKFKAATLDAMHVLLLGTVFC